MGNSGSNGNPQNGSKNNRNKRGVNTSHPAASINRRRNHSSHQGMHSSNGPVIQPDYPRNGQNLGSSQYAFQKQRSIIMNSSVSPNNRMNPRKPSPEKTSMIPPSNLQYLNSSSPSNFVRQSQIQKNLTSSTHSKQMLKSKSSFQVDPSLQQSSYRANSFHPNKPLGTSQRIMNNDQIAQRNLTKNVLQRRHSDNSIAMVKQQKAKNDIEIAKQPAKSKIDIIDDSIEFMADYRLCLNLFAGSAQSLAQLSLISLNSDLVQPFQQQFKPQTGSAAAAAMRQTFGPQQRDIELQTYLQFLHDLESTSVSSIDFIHLSELAHSQTKPTKSSQPTSKRSAKNKEHEQEFLQFVDAMRSQFKDASGLPLPIPSSQPGSNQSSKIKSNTSFDLSQNQPKQTESFHKLPSANNNDFSNISENNYSQESYSISQKKLTSDQKSKLSAVNFSVYNHPSLSDNPNSNRTHQLIQREQQFNEQNDTFDSRNHSRPFFDNQKILANHNESDNNNLASMANLEEQSKEEYNQQAFAIESDDNTTPRQTGEFLSNQLLQESELAQLREVYEQEQNQQRGEKQQQLVDSKLKNTLNSLSTSTRNDKFPNQKIPQTHIIIQDQTTQKITKEQPQNFQNKEKFHPKIEDINQSNGSMEEFKQQILLIEDHSQYYSQKEQNQIHHQASSFRNPNEPLLTNKNIINHQLITLNKQPTFAASNESIHNSSQNSMQGIDQQHFNDSSLHQSTESPHFQNQFPKQLEAQPNQIQLLKQQLQQSTPQTQDHSYQQTQSQLNIQVSTNQNNEKNSQNELKPDQLSINSELNKKQSHFIPNFQYRNESTSRTEDDFFIRAKQHPQQHYQQQINLNQQNQPVHQLQTSHMQPNEVKIKSPVIFNHQQSPFEKQKNKNTWIIQGRKKEEEQQKNDLKIVEPQKQKNKGFSQNKTSIQKQEQEEQPPEIVDEYDAEIQRHEMEMKEINKLIQNHSNHISTPIDSFIHANQLKSKPQLIPSNQYPKPSPRSYGIQEQSSKKQNLAVPSSLNNTLAHELNSSRSKPNLPSSASQTGKTTTSNANNKYTASYLNTQSKYATQHQKKKHQQEGSYSKMLFAEKPDPNISISNDLHRLSSELRKNTAKSNSSPIKKLDIFQDFDDTQSIKNNEEEEDDSETESQFKSNTATGAVAVASASNRSRNPEPTSNNRPPSQPIEVTMDLLAFKRKPEVPSTLEQSTVIPITMDITQFMQKIPSQPQEQLPQNIPGRIMPAGLTVGSPTSLNGIERQNSDAEGESILKSVTRHLMILKGKIEKDQQELDQNNISYQTKITTNAIRTIADTSEQQQPYQQQQELPIQAKPFHLEQQQNQQYIKKEQLSNDQNNESYFSTIPGNYNNNNQSQLAQTVNEIDFASNSHPLKQFDNQQYVQEAQDHFSMKDSLESEENANQHHDYFYQQQQSQHESRKNTLTEPNQGYTSAPGSGRVIPATFWVETTSEKQVLNNKSNFERTLQKTVWSEAILPNSRKTNPMTMSEKSSIPQTKNDNMVNSDRSHHHHHHQQNPSNSVTSKRNSNLEYQEQSQMKSLSQQHQQQPHSKRQSEHQTTSGNRTNNSSTSLKNKNSFNDNVTRKGEIKFYENPPASRVADSAPPMIDQSILRKPIGGINTTNQDRSSVYSATSSLHDGYNSSYAFNRQSEQPIQQEIQGNIPPSKKHSIQSDNRKSSIRSAAGFQFQNEDFNFHQNERNYENERRFSEDYRKGFPFSDNQNRDSNQYDQRYSDEDDDDEDYQKKDEGEYSTQQQTGGFDFGAFGDAEEEYEHEQTGSDSNEDIHPSKISLDLKSFKKA